jgi:putative transposase
MSRPLRIRVAGGVYHVFARGNAKQQIFLDDSDRRSFLGVVNDALRRFEWRCLTYCLMPNHYHLVFVTPKPDLSRGMRQINGVYAQRFNRRHDRCGHVFQGRFGAALVESDEHLLELIRYVALNPVRAGLANCAEDWRWSGHGEVLELTPSRLVSTQDLLSHFHSNGAEAFARYRQFVAEGEMQWTDVQHEPIVGSPNFIAEHLPPGRPSTEIPLRSWRANRPSLKVLLEADDGDAAVTHAFREHGYLMKEIAEVLGCHYATVSRRIRRFEARQGETT